MEIVWLLIIVSKLSWNQFSFSYRSKTNFFIQTNISQNIFFCMKFSFFLYTMKSWMQKVKLVFCFLRLVFSKTLTKTWLFYIACFCMPWVMHDQLKLLQKFRILSFSFIVCRRHQYSGCFESSVLSIPVKLGA